MLCGFELRESITFLSSNARWNTKSTSNKCTQFTSPILKPDLNFRLHICHLWADFFFFTNILMTYAGKCKSIPTFFYSSELCLITVIHLKNVPNQKETRLVFLCAYCICYKYLAGRGHGRRVTLSNQKAKSRRLVCILHKSEACCRKISFVIFAEQLDLLSSDEPPLDWWWHYKNTGISLEADAEFSWCIGEPLELELSNVFFLICSS